MNYLGISRILEGLTAILGTATGLYLTGALLGGILFSCLFALVKLVLYDLYHVRHFTKISLYFSASLLKEMVLKCWVISLSSGIASLTGNLPRYMVKNYLDMSFLGFFSGISVVTMGLSLVAVALVSSALRRLAVYFRSDVPKFLRLLAKLIVIAVGFGLINLLFTLIAGKYFLTIFFDASYVEYFPAMCIYAVAGITMAVVGILGDAIISTHHYWWRIIASTARFSVIFLAGYYLIPLYQLNGLCLACVIGVVFEVIVCVAGLGIISKRQRRNRQLHSNSELDDDIITEVDA